MTMTAQETADSLAEMTGAFERRRDAILAALLAERKAALAEAAACCDAFDGPASDSDFVMGQATAAQQIRAAILAPSPEGKGPDETERAKAGLSEAVIEGENIVIRVPISTLPIAFTYWPDAPRDGEGNPLYRVTDAAEWARSIVCRLNDEEEDGTTRIHRMLDDAMNEALEQGDEGIEEIPCPPTDHTPEEET